MDVLILDTPENLTFSVQYYSNRGSFKIWTLLSKIGYSYGILILDQITGFALTGQLAMAAEQPKASISQIQVGFESPSVQEYVYVCCIIKVEIFDASHGHPSKQTIF